MTSTSERLLRQLPLFAGVELGELAGVLSAADLAAGEELWRQGQPADALYVVETGTVVVAARLPGGREVELATLGPGEVLGELALLDGGLRSATVRSLEPTRVLRLGGAEFHALVGGRDEGARALRRRLAELACARLRERHRALAASLTGELAAVTAARGQAAQPPERAYLLGLPFFREYEGDALDELLAHASVERVAPGAVLVAEGDRPRALFDTLNGAVEEAIRRAGSAIRVALAGPGRGFGYAGLIAGGAATATAAARERAIVLAVEPGELEGLLANDSFAAAITRDVVRAVRQAERPQARLAVARGDAQGPVS
ncbi:MAG: cyclic nucleotide-binding domain-containing protein [Gaiellaceae bacterium]